MRASHTFHPLLHRLPQRVSNPFSSTLSECSLHSRFLPTFMPTICLFKYLFMFQANQKGLGPGVLHVKVWDNMCCILNLPENNKVWKGHFFTVKIKDPLPIDNFLVVSVINFKHPRLTDDLREASWKTNVESYDYNLYKSAHNYGLAKLKPPIYPWSIEIQAEVVLDEGCPNSHNFLLCYL